MDCVVQPSSQFWNGAIPHGLTSFHQRNYFPNFYFPRKRTFNSSFYPGHSLFFPHDVDDVDYPTDIKGELTQTTMPYPCMADESGEIKMCAVCGERASGFYFGALVCLPCKSFYIRCTKEGEPAFTCQCSGNCDIVKQGRIRCQYCRYQRCLMAGMCRKEKPETVQPAEGQVLCKVCGDIANGIHFGVNTCEGCKKFFRRGLVENQSYICKGEKDCGINPRNRNNCRYCRYQKCIGVGMSREAIKMGRPKKADGSDATPPNSSSNSPKMARHQLVDIDNLNQQTLTTPLCREEHNDTLKSSSVRDKIKVESDRPSCEYQKKTGEMWSEGSNLNQWSQQCGPAPMPCISNTTPPTNSTTNVASSEFIEEEMDEILMLLQNDNQSGVNSWKFGPKKMRSYYGYSGIEAQKECKTEYCEGPQAPTWHMPDMPASQPAMGGMSPMNMSMNNEPMNMTTNQMSGIPSRPPPQYPGYNNNNAVFPQQQQQQQDQLQSGAGMPSPCHSPSSRQMPSPGGYMSDASVHSPGYIPNSSPVHVIPCQYNPQNSPVYHNSPSPQSSPYHSDSSPQGSPYNEQIYHPNTFSHPVNYLDLSVNVNCEQMTSNNNNNMAPGSPTNHSPHYKTNSHMTMTGQSSPSSQLTIPIQEGGVISHESWSLTGSPHHSFCHSPSQNNPATIPSQERGIKRGSSSHENLQRINHYFTTPSTCNRSELTLLAKDEGAITRSDIEREVVYKTLASVSPTESYNYIMSEGHSSSSDSNGSSYDEFTSCRRQNKRKSCNDSEMCDSLRSEGFQVGRYKRQMTEKYWQASVNMEDTFPMTTEKQALLEHLNSIFQKMADRCTEATKQTNSQDGRNWQQIQLRIVRNTSAGVKFASQIPGFSNLHPEDKTFLCKNVGFMSALLTAGYQQYNPAEKNFRDFWNWHINPQNPFYPFKHHLVEIGEKIHTAHMDMYEVAALTALLYLGADFQDLCYPEAIEDARRQVIAALQSYLMSKGVDVKSRISELFSLVPEIRHVGMWQHELMKQMKVNIRLQEVHSLFDTVSFRES